MAYIYPQNREIQAIGPDKVARAQANRVGFQLLPERAVNAGRVEWTQRDNYRGLQQLRGLDGAPSHVARVGENRYSYAPGVYGEFEVVTETELVNRAGGVTADVPIDVSDLVMSAQDQLISRENDRKESIIWTLLTTGTFSVTSPGGNVVFTDTFTLQTQSASDWSTVATATPMADLRATALLGLGRGVTFNGRATAYMNQVTANYLFANTNANDYGGKKLAGGANFLSLREINGFLLDNDLPQVVIYDEGYYNDANSFVRFIPTDKVVVVGARASGERLGEYVLTRNAMNPGMAPGSYEFVKDKTGNGPDGQKQVPPSIEVHRGHNGGPVLYFPSAIVLMSV